MIPPNSIVPFKLNESSPQYAGLDSLLSYWTGVQKHEVLHGIPADFTAGTGYAWDITEHGQSFYVADTSSGAGRMRVQYLPSKFNTLAGSLLVWISFNSKPTAGDTCQVTVRHSTGGQSFCDFNLDGFMSDGLPFRIRNGAPQFSYVVCNPTIPTSFAVGDFALYMGTYWWDGSTTYYVDWHRIRNEGEYHHYSNSGAINQLASSGIQELIVYPSGSSTNPWSYDLYEMRYYNRVLSVQEMWNIWNPSTRFDLYKQAVNPKYFSWTNLYQTKMRPVGGR